MVARSNRNGGRHRAESASACACPSSPDCVIGATRTPSPDRMTSRKAAQCRLCKSGSAERRISMTLAEVSLGVFSAFSGIRLISYLPQIFRVAHDTNGASAISYSTWIMWTACSVLYAVCCISVICITFIKRRRQFVQLRSRPQELPDASNSISAT
jgi:hypothetical protein